MKELITRTLAGVVFIAIVITSILLSEFSFLGLFIVIILIAQTEFEAIVKQKSKRISLLVALCSTATITLSFLVNYEFIGQHWLMAVPLLFILLFIVVLLTPGVPMTRTLGNVSLFFLWIIVPQTLFLLTAKIHKGEYNPYIPLSIIIMTWIYDTFAYLTGMLTGKHKMFPALSPKKSWEGFAGGVVFTALLAGIFGPITGFLDHFEWVITGIFAAVTSMFGDLLESRFKREHEVKDSGKLIPGHGGILDRFDSLFFSVPAVYALFLLFRV